MLYKTLFLKKKGTKYLKKDLKNNILHQMKRNLKCKNLNLKEKERN